MMLPSPTIHLGASLAFFLALPAGLSKEMDGELYPMPVEK